MFNILKSYWLRTKRTPARAVLVLCPLGFACIFSVYTLFSTALKGLEMAYYFLAFAILACFSISFFIPMLYESDKKAGMYANDLRCGIGRKKLFFARFLFVVVLLLLIELLAGVPFLLFLYVHGRSVNLPDFISYLLIPLLSLPPMIPLYQFLSLMFHYSGSILTGGMFTLAAILLGTTNLGEGTWYFFPFVYPVKFTVLYAEHLLTVSEIIMFLMLSFSISMLSLFLGSFWYNKWDGISLMGE